MLYPRILVALSFKYDETPVIVEAARIAEALGSHVTALHVNDPQDSKPTMMMPMTGHKETVEDLINTFREAGHADLAAEIDARILTDTSFENAIVAASKDFDLIVIGHKKVSALKAAFSDSTDEGVTNKVDCPVLTVPIP